MTNDDKWKELFGFQNANLKADWSNVIATWPCYPGSNREAVLNLAREAKMLRDLIILHGRWRCIELRCQWKTG